MSKCLLSNEKIARKFHLVQSVLDGYLTVGDAAEALGCAPRTVYRMIARFCDKGVAGLIHGGVGRPSNNRIPDKTRGRIVQILNDDLRDYPPKHASEILRDEYGITVSRTTVSTIMTKEGLWHPNSKGNRTRKVKQLRKRYPNVGDFIQFDGTKFEWLHGPGPLCLLVFIDDATTRSMHLALVKKETTLDYLREWMTYINLHGCPRRVYGDQHAAIFKTTKSSNQTIRLLETDLARALGSLGILCWPSTNASGRGRVERAHQTIKPRLARELERHKVKTLEDANAFLPGFIKAFNSNPDLTVKPECDADHHFPPPRDVPLDLVFTKRRTCKVSSRLSVSLNGETLLLPDIPNARPLANRKVIVAESPSGLATVLTEAGHFALRRPG